MSDLVFEKLSQALAASESWRLNIAGDFFRLSEAAYPVSVSLLKGLRIVGTMRNMLAGDYVRDIAFDGVIIENGAMGQNVSAQIAGGGAGSDRVMGEVSVINGEVANVKAGRCFVKSSGVGAVAGQYPHVQIYNPAGSGKNVILSKVTVFSAASIRFSLMRYNTPLATLSGAGYAKKASMPDAAAVVRMENNVARLGVPVANFAIGAPETAVEVPFAEPFIIEQGGGLVISDWAVNHEIYATFQWSEENA